MKEPVSTYTQKILQDKGDKKIKKGVMNVNTFRDEQYAELSRIIHTKQSKYLAQITTKTLDKQIAFFKTMSKTEESKCPDCGEDVALSGDHGRADVGKKKKKIAKVPRGFEFKEAIDEHWESLIQEVRFKAFTHSSSFVGNVKYDQDNQSMEIILNGSTYDFCNVSERLYDSFEGADSKGAFFNREIKTLHDC